MYLMDMTAQQDAVQNHLNTQDCEIIDLALSKLDSQDQSLKGQVDQQRINDLRNRIRQMSGNQQSMSQSAGGAYSKA